MKRILITGNKGFLGSNLYSYLEELGYDVLGLDEDIRDKDAVRPYFIGTEIVIHAAAIVPKENEEPGRDYYGVNVLGTKNIAELCIENNCKLIYFSTTAKQRKYGKTKQEAQKLVETFASKGLKTVILRLCPIVKRDDPLMKWGRRYPIEYLVEDIENIIKTNDFDKFKLIDYKEVTRNYEESSDIHIARP